MLRQLCFELLIGNCDETVLITTLNKLKRENLRALLFEIQPQIFDEMLLITTLNELGEMRKSCYEA